jgi:hypothetical protein
MKTKTRLLPGVTATTLMSIFSYTVSSSKDKNFKEPKLLAEMVEQFLPDKDKKMATPTGWVMHYTMGCLMTLVFQEVWKKAKTKPSFVQGVVAGLIGGVTGILIWKTVFKVHPNPPQIPFKRYYGHLMLAHLVFGISAALTSRSEPPFKSKSLERPDNKHIARKT